MSKRSPFGPYADSRDIPEVESLRTYIDTLSDKEKKLLDVVWSDEEWKKFQGQYHGVNALEDLKKKSIEILDGLKEDLSDLRDKIEFEKFPENSSIGILQRFEKFPEHWQKYIYLRFANTESDNSFLSKFEPQSDKPLTIIFSLMAFLDSKKLDFDDQLKKFKLLKRLDIIMREINCHFENELF